MAYTVKKLAAMSGVSVRTLHFYDEVGLLKPAYLGANGYRFYEEAQLLLLQQILFYRTLGIELQQIRRIIGSPDFDKVAALETHRKVLRKSLSDTRKLIRTIDKTIEHLKGTKKMKSQELFAGFDRKQQAKHERYLIERYGDGMKKSIADSKKRVKDWTKADWEKSGRVFAEICEDMAGLIRRRASESSSDAQEIVRRHYEWLKAFWTPTRESYTGHTTLIEESELGKAYEAYHPRLPRFMGTAIRVFAERELS